MKLEKFIENNRTVSSMTKDGGGAIKCEQLNTFVVTYSKIRPAASAAWVRGRPIGRR